jgi:hypothetical protein
MDPIDLCLSLLRQTLNVREEFNTAYFIGDVEGRGENVMGSFEPFCCEGLKVQIYDPLIELFSGLRSLWPQVRHV